MEHQSKGDSMNSKFHGLSWRSAWCRLLTQSCLAKETGNHFPFHSYSVIEARSTLRELSEIPFPVQNEDDTTSISLLCLANPALSITLSSAPSVSSFDQGTVKFYWPGSPLVSPFLVACLSCSHPTSMAPIETV